MKVLLDESTPRRLALSFPGSIETRTVQQMGWAGCANGELLRLAAEHGFDALVTVDNGFAYQQNVNELGNLIRLAYAFEQAIHVRRPPQFRPAAV